MKTQKFNRPTPRRPALPNITILTPHYQLAVEIAEKVGLTIEEIEPGKVAKVQGEAGFCLLKSG